MTFEKTTQPDGSSTVAMLDPKLHCVISQYEAGYKDIRVYPYSMYTDELVLPTASLPSPREYIESVLRNSIDEQFITFD